MAKVIVSSRTRSRLALPSPLSGSLSAGQQRIFNGIDEGELSTAEDISELIDKGLIVVSVVEDPGVDDELEGVAKDADLDTRTTRIDKDVNRGGPAGQMMQRFRNTIQQSFQRLAKDNENEHQALSSALSGQVEIVLPGGLTREVSAAAMNAAAAGTAGESFAVVLQCNVCPIDMLWAQFPLTFTPAVVTGGTAGPPVVSGGKLNKGRAWVSLIADTDGSTIVYSPGDTISVTIKVSATDELLGYTVTPVVFTCNVVA